MSKFGHSFHGADIVLPGVYTYTDLSAMRSPSGVPSRAVAIVAEGKGGATGALTRVTTQQQVERALIGGDAANMARIAMAAGASDIYVARVNQAVAATLDLGDLTLEHRNPGASGNRTQVKRAENAGRSDAVDLTIKDTAVGVTETFKALGPLLDLTYSGASVSPTAVMSTSSGVVTVTLTGETGETIVLSSDAVDDVRDAAALINESGVWSAAVVGDPNASLALLDGTTATFTTGAATLNAGAAAQALALDGSQIVSGTATAAASTSTGAFQFLAGGTEGAAVTATEYINALALVEGVEVIAVVLGSEDGAVVAAGRSHAYAMSTIAGRRERLLYVGGGTHTLKSDLETELLALAASNGGERVVIAGNTVKDFDASGQLVAYPGYYLAAFAAGLKSGNRPEISLTNKAITLPGLGFVFDDEELTALSEAGVMIANFDATAGRNVIRDGITSWTMDNTHTKRSIAGMDSMDWLNKRVRIAMQPFIGAVGDRTLVQSVRLAAERVLKSETRGTEGVLTAGTNPQTGEPVEAFENLRVTFDGMTITSVTYEAHPVGENKYMFVESAFTPVQISA